MVPNLTSKLLVYKWRSYCFYNDYLCIMHTYVKSDVIMDNNDRLQIEQVV